VVIEFNVNDFGVFPNGDEWTNLVLPSGSDPDQTITFNDVPVWLAIQIIINRAASVGGTVYLPGPTPDIILGLPMRGRLPSYNLNQGHLVIPGNMIKLIANTLWIDARIHFNTVVPFPNPMPSCRGYIPAKVLNPQTGVWDDVCIPYF
jgi:hypothetical protein